MNKFIYNNCEKLTSFLSASVKNKRSAIQPISLMIASDASDVVIIVVSGSISFSRDS